jgi:hypothetical protein
MMAKKIANTSKRAIINRIDRIEDMRERIVASQMLTKISNVENKLLDLRNEMTAIEVARLSKVLDSYYKALAKVLPDLKSIELVKRSEDILTLQSMDPESVNRIRSAISESLLGRKVSERLQTEEVSECLQGGVGALEVGGVVQQQRMPPSASYSDSNDKLIIDAEVYDGDD